MTIRQTLDATKQAEADATAAAKQSTVSLEALRIDVATIKSECDQISAAHQQCKQTAKRHGIAKTFKP